MKLHRTGWLRVLSGALMLWLAAGTAQAGLEQEPEIRAFIAEMQAKHGFSEAELNALFSQAEMLPSVIEAMDRPAEARPWFQYRPIFLTEARIAAGVEFWRQYSDVLARAAQTYGVAEEVILAILGVETRYGVHTGRFRVLDSLVTLAFYYPKRAAFFRSELEQFLLLTREEKIDPLQTRGSYAGAMGMPQFISSSYRHYAVDFDGDGRRDLLNSPADAIGSVANYFSKHGWENGKPVVAVVRVTGDRYKNLLNQGMKPTIQTDELANYDIEPVDSLTAKATVALVEVQQQNALEYWLGYNNFYVITRYNRSPLYAMAVHQLSRELRARNEGRSVGAVSP